MATKSVQLPDIGEGVTEGELVQWLVQVGDTVEDDQPVAEVMTDKATVEVPTPFAGTVKELKAQEGDVIPIETEILVLETSGAAQEEAPQKEEPKKEEPKQEASASSTSEPAATAGTQATQTIHPPVAEVNVLATPSTRRLAREMSVDINQVGGSGLAGRVTREDVLSAKPSAAPAATNGSAQPSISTPQFKTPAPLPVDSAEREERVALRGIRRKIAENMQMTKQVVPHFTLMDECNVTELVKLRTQAKSAGEKHNVKITYLPFVMKSLIATIRDYPMFNASIDDQAQEIVYKKYFNIGFAADTPNGLVVPVIKDADRKSILQISAEIMDLAGRAREGKLKPDEMKGATITVTNIGSVGGNYATPIINHPEVAILGMYKIVDKPIMKDGKFRAAKVMNYTITADHRLIDGAVAANFLNAFMKRLENPSHLMLEMI
ncbi:MAG: 2-oxo acid dehydrogenase subunit E2 [Bdellovibrionales bacterium]|nr:2-oxo acid dehydrogenase subunit E2 [Bdellovibrionales bacterium]